MKKRTVCMLSALLLCFAAAGTALGGISESEADCARLLCLNIGKADCMLLAYEGSFYLIDTGYSQTYPALTAALREMGVTHLNGVFLTHCHQDHQGGLMPLAQSSLPVDAWYAARIFYDQKASKHPALLAAWERGMDVEWLDAGDVIPVGQHGSLTVLGPLTVNEDNENNNSLVLRFSSPAGSILFAGDMKEDEEGELLNAGLLSPCDVLKVGHHGDSGASSKAFLNAVMPRAAIILTNSQEEPDTPAVSTLRRLENTGAKVYVSQDYHDALLLTLENGAPTVEDVSWQGVPERAAGLSLRLNLDQDTVTISNNGFGSLSLQGCMMYSTKGNELLPVPDVTLAPGASCVIGTQATKTSVDYVWDEKQVWHKTKSDFAILYDAYGRPLCCTGNGIGE